MKLPKSTTLEHLSLLCKRTSNILPHACVLSRFYHVQLFATPWTVTRQALLSIGILQARRLEWEAMPSSRGSSRPRVRTHVAYSSCAAGRFFTAEPPKSSYYLMLAAKYAHLGESGFP